MDGDGSVAEELRGHEALLRDGRPAARAVVVRGTAVSYGVRVPPTAGYLERARAAGIPTAARTSGGTGILHLDGDLLWAIVLPRRDPRASRGFVRGYRRLGAAIVETLSRRGLVASWGPPPGTSEAYCPLSSRGEVLWIGDRVVGAAAQHATGTALLHHGSLAWTVDRPTVAKLFGLALPGPPDRLGSLTEARLAGPALRLAEELGERLAAGL